MLAILILFVAMFSAAHAAGHPVYNWVRAKQDKSVTAADRRSEKITKAYLDVSRTYNRGEMDSQNAHRLARGFLKHDAVQSLRGNNVLGDHHRLNVHRVADVAGDQAQKGHPGYW